MGGSLEHLIGLCRVLGDPSVETHRLNFESMTINVVLGTLQLFDGSLNCLQGRVEIVQGGQCEEMRRLSRS